MNLTTGGLVGSNLSARAVQVEMTAALLGAAILRRISFVVLTFGIVVGFASCVPVQAATVHQEMRQFKVLVKEPADVTWSDPDCAADAPNYGKAALQDASTSLSRAGFLVVRDVNALFDVRATVSVNLTQCAKMFAHNAVGIGSIQFEGGGASQGGVGFGVMCRGDRPPPPGGTCFDPMAQELAEAPQTHALIARLGAQQAQSGSSERHPAQPPPAQDAIAGGQDSAGTNIHPTKPSPKPTNAQSADSSPVASTHLRTGAAQSTAVAVVVGIEQYRDITVPAVGAGGDADQFAEVARRTLGLPASQVLVLKADRATRADIERALDWAKNNVSSRGRIYFYFSGHGAPEPSAGTSYLVPYDGTPTALAASAISLQHVADALKASQAKEAFVFVDACFSGEGARSVLAPGIRPLVREKIPTGSANVLIFAGASGMQVAGGANGRPAGGVFTSFLVEGIGSGQADIDGDGTVSIGELKNWVSPRVERAARSEGRAQKPTLVLGASLSLDTPVVSGL